MKHTRPRSRALRIAPLAAAVVALSGSLDAAPRAGAISGAVADAEDGKPIAGALIRLVGGQASATSDAAGRFRLAPVPAGKRAVICTAAGFQTSRAKGIRVGPGAEAVIRLSMRKRAGADKGVAEAAGKSAGKSADKSLGKSAGKSADKDSEAADRSRAGARTAPRPRRHARKMKQATVSLGIAGSMSSGHGGYGAGSAAVRMHAYAAAPSPRPAAESRPPTDREGYDPSEDNEFRSPRDKPLSTFAIDVDTASYANVRRFIEREGRLPPADAVRIEEMINYFHYDYPDPAGPHPFAVYAEVSTAPWQPSHRLVHIGVQAKRVATQDLPANNLTLLIDVSGSMSNPDKLPLLKRALALLVHELRSQDRVAIVVYAGAAGLVLPPTTGDDKATILGALERLQAGGSTAGGQGIQLAYEVAARSMMKHGNNRVILATDGDFNVGASSDGELVRIIEEKRKGGIFLTVLGFGTGNYQDAKMQKLADKGNGNHAYIDSILEARKVLVTEMGGTLVTVAKDVKVQVEFNPALVKGWRLIGYINRKLADRDFNDDKKDAGELGAGHSVTVLYEVIPAGSAEAVGGVDPLKYQQGKYQQGKNQQGKNQQGKNQQGGPSEAATSGELMTVKLRYKQPNGDKSILLSEAVGDRHVDLDATSADYRFAAAVAGFGMLLRDSKHKGTASWQAIAALARGAIGADADSLRYDLVKLLDKASLLARTGG